MIAETAPSTVVSDLSHVVLRVAESARSVARTRRVLLSVEVESGALLVPGIERVVEDAVLDVVGQAVSTCDAGALVVLDLHRTDGGVALDVVDTGNGVPCGRFDSPTARAVVEAEGGHVGHSSVEGVGTSVRLWWPLAAAGAASSGPHLAAV
ncbi:ATP-binding protein [Phycicoccus flavus]|uniref:HAMP domain-containing histidine kinase n=1 Tax=Phycicoccus flavus TaxID=2502783 RepID=UPI000FEBE9DD|nr:HAMP domain-containing histidine kinase [Phycicoccus flavus]NHA68652.1 HAMP domain-containing histidine kinase [Phycicoccus flavus]